MLFDTFGGVKILSLKVGEDYAALSINPERNRGVSLGHVERIDLELYNVYMRRMCCLFGRAGFFM